MSSTTLISVSEYLKSSYRPDCDYVDGRVEERNVGEHDHAALQAELIFWFRQHQLEWSVEVLPEQREFRSHRPDSAFRMYVLSLSISPWSRFSPSLLWLAWKSCPLKIRCAGCRNELRISASLE